MPEDPSPPSNVIPGNFPRRQGTPEEWAKVNADRAAYRAKLIADYAANDAPKVLAELRAAHAQAIAEGREPPPVPPATDKVLRLTLGDAYHVP